jgi:hypothetical protein
LLPGWNGVKNVADNPLEVLIASVGKALYQVSALLETGLLKILISYLHKVKTFNLKPHKYLQISQHVHTNLPYVLVCIHSLGVCPELAMNLVQIAN